MADASYVQSGFSGGEISKLAQGRYHDPEYRTYLNACLNLIPTENEAIVRRPGFQYVGLTRNAAPGRVLSFNFQAAFPYTIELTDTHMRLRAGPTLVTNNDSVGVLAISAANPAVVQTSAAVTWATGDSAYFTNLGTSDPLLQNRALLLTKVDTTHFSISDPVANVNINGATLGTYAGGATINRILDFMTPYVGGHWATVRSVQAELTSFLLHGLHPPQALNVTAQPTVTTFASFSFAPAVFGDGPYLDPPTNGALMTPSAQSGIITLSLSFAAWVSTQAYAAGAFVVSSSVVYQSLQDQNVGNIPLTTGVTNGTTAAGNATLHFAATGGFGLVNGMTIVDTTSPSVIPPNTTILSFTGTTVLMSNNATGGGVGNGDTITFTSAAFWAPTSAGAAINTGQGFLGTDVGRLVRLYSEPAVWASGTSYVAGNVVTYNPSGLPGQSTYWQALTGTTGNPPGTDITHWQLLPQGGTSSPAQWTWGKIVSLINGISGSLAGSANIGNLTGGGGLAASFDGVFPKLSGPSSSFTQVTGTNLPPGFTLTLSNNVGKNYTGATPQQINHVTVYPSTDQGLASGFYLAPGLGGVSVPYAPTITVNLRAKASAPSNPTDGTLLGTTGPISNTTSSISIFSNDQVTAWNYVWIDIETSWTNTYFANTESLSVYVSQAIFFNPPSTSTTANAVNLEILGPPLLYSNAIHVWRLGVFSGTTGYPTCGTYHEGRLWLAGATPNRIDSSMSNGVGTGQNGIALGTVNFAPTDQYGNVLASSGISAVFDAPDVNPIFWLISDLQGIIAGSKGGEWLVQAPTAGPISAVNISAHRVTTIGCANIEARRTEHTTVFVQKFGRKIAEYFPDVFSGKFTAPYINLLSKHLTASGVAELAYQQELNPIVWARLNNGGLVAWTYRRDTLMTSQGPTMNAGHRHTLGSGRQVTSICTGPNAGGTLDALTAVTFDPATALYHVEILADTLDEGSTLFQANFLDNAVVPTSTTTSNTTPAPYGGLTLNGLWHLNGKTVTAWLAGLDCGDYTVSNGSITVPYGDGVAAGTATGLFTAAYYAANPTALVGFTYTSQGQIVRPNAREESGARSGPGFGKKRRNHYVIAHLEGTQGVSFGTDFVNNIEPAIFRQDGGTAYAVNVQFSGIFRDQVKNDYDFDGMLCWQVTRPYICNIAALGGAIQTQDI